MAVTTFAAIDIGSYEVSMKIDLAFCDISGKVWDRVCDVVVWHGQDRSIS